MTPSRSGRNLIGKISSYLQIVTRDPHSTAFVPLAEAYRQIGLLDDALEAARLGTSMLPHFSPGFATLGRILGQIGRLDEAMSAYARALSIDRQSQSALVGLARLHLMRGERDQARKILIEAAEFHPQDEMVQNMLVALDLPRPWDTVSQAVAGVEEPVAPAGEPAPAGEADAGKPIPTATLAEIYVKQGLIDQAIGVYAEILQADPGNALVIRRMAELRGSEGPAPVTVTTAPAEPAPQSPQPPRNPLEVFEMWLRAIQSRRVHVQ